MKRKSERGNKSHPPFPSSGTGQQTPVSIWGRMGEPSRPSPSQDGALGRGQPVATAAAGYQLRDARQPQVTRCPFISLSIIGHLPLASPDVRLYQTSTRFSVFIESLVKKSSRWSGTLIVRFYLSSYHVQNVPGTIRRHKRLRKHSFRGRKLTVAWRRHGRADIYKHLPNTISERRSGQHIRAWRQGSGG